MCAYILNTLFLIEYISEYWILFLFVNFEMFEYKIFANLLIFHKKNETYYRKHIHIYIIQSNVCSIRR